MVVLADISDVEQAICSLILDATYPAGLQNHSMSGMPIKIYRGWPANKTLNKDLLAGTQTVTVFSRPNSTRDTSRFARIWRTVGETSPRAMIDVIGNTAVLTGSGGGGQTIGLIVGGIGYAYSANDADSLDTIAQALAALIPMASAQGTVITVPGRASLQGRVVGSGIAELGDKH